mgnify:CR=1 FL=1|tara:strand:- start:622 stop:1140 length:519 start_codon:yes stop_codon:yes gene_type:complete
MDTSLFTSNILSIQVTLDSKTLTSNDACKDKDDPINYILEKKIKKEVGNKCVKEGYVSRDTIQVVDRSIGTINSEQFNGSISYNVRYKALICCPTKGMQIKAKVLSINKMGVLAENKPLSIVIARQHQPDKALLKDIDIGDTINITLLASRFELYSTEICSIGIIPSVNEDT